METAFFSGLRHLWCRTWRRAVPVLLALAAAVALAMPHGARADGSLVNQWTDVGGPVQVHFVYTDKNGTPQDESLTSAPQPLLGALPSGLQQLQTSPLLTAPLGSAFDQLWSELSGPAWESVSQQISSDVSSPDEGQSVYNLSNWNIGQLGALQATQESQWQCTYPCTGDTVTGQRILLDFEIPMNSVVFNVTTPNTCRQSNLVCAADPQFTAIFDIHLYLALTSPNPSTLQVPLAVSATSSVDLDEVLEGDQSSAIKNALTSAAASAGVSVAAGAATGAAAPFVTGAGVLATIVKLAAQLSGIAVAASGNSHLRDEVSARLSDLYMPGATPTVLNGAPGLQDLDKLFQGFQAANSAGFTQFGVSATSDGSLRFTLSDPATATTAPTLQERTPQSSGQGLFQPVILLSEAQAHTGDQLVVSGSNFNTQSTPDVWLAWNNPNPGMDSADLEEQSATNGQWQPTNGQWQPATFAAEPDGANQVSGLTPYTAYWFQVRNCDAVSCSPYSNTVGATTAGAGSGQVAFYIDSISPANQIPGPAATLGDDGSFSWPVTIPSGTASGQHTIYAVTGGGPSQPVANAQQASRSVTIVAAGKSFQPVIQVIDPTLNEVVQSIEQSSTFTVQGQGFAPGNVTITLGTTSGQVLGGATAAVDGTFTATLTAPSSLPTGNQTLVASDSANGQTIQATDSVFVQALPR